MILCHGVGFAYNQTPPSENLRVGFIDSAPFSFTANNEKKGVAYDLWELISRENNYTNQYVSIGGNIDNAVSMVHNGEIDMAIGPIIFESNRFDQVNFTAPFFFGKMVLVVRTDTKGFWKKLNQLLFRGYPIQIFMILFVIFLLYIHGYWFLERDTLKLSGKSYNNAIHYLFHLAILQTLGGNPIATPKTTSMTVFSSVWIFIFQFYIYAILAGVTVTLMSIDRSKKPSIVNRSDFAQRPVLVYGGNAFLQLAHEAGLNVTASTLYLSDAIAALEGKSVDGVFMPYASAASYINSHLNTKVAISGVQFQHVYFGFIFNSKKYDLLPKVNSTMFKIIENGGFISICKNYSSELLWENCQ